jgi:hypothetical protein
VPRNSALKWEPWFQAADGGENHVGCLRSTVLLWLEDSFMLFETMIFGNIEDTQTRCLTWHEAEAMHAKAVAHGEQMVKKSSPADRWLEKATEMLRGNSVALTSS